MRKGLNPLSVHIGMAAAEMARQGGGNSADYQDSFAKMLQGIQKYQTYEGTIAVPPLTPVWQAGQARLLRLVEQPDHQHKIPVILIPSLVNRAGVLNLTHDRSMMRYFAQQGLTPLLLDWGESCADEGQATCEGLITQRLLAAAQATQDLYGTKPHALGYCMGGTLLAAALALAPDRFASATFLAAPWDFHAGARALQKRVEFWGAAAMQSLKEKGYLDQTWLQTLFASLDPLLTRNKFMKFAAMEEGSAEAQLFVAIEDWLNDGADLPQDIASLCIQGWFFDNQPAQKKWQLGGQIIDPSNIETPCLVVASQQDRLVEYDCAMALAQQLPNVQHISPSCGHIGMIAGRKAVQDVWQPIAAFIAYCNNAQP